MSIISPFNIPNIQKPGQKLTFGNLPGNSLALTIANTIKNFSGLALVIVPDMLTAQRMMSALSFFLPNIDIFNFPDWETLPYDNFSPHQDIISQRLSTLTQLLGTQSGALIVPITTLLQRLPPKSYLESSAFILHRKDKINLDELRKRLESRCYRCVGQVMEHGEFAVRGSIIDIFPAGSDLPYRIELFDDEVDTLRTFDPETQRSIAVVDNIRLLPAREFPLTDEAITCFRQNWRTEFPGNPSECSIYQDVSQGFSPPGIEYYLPLFYQETQNLLDYVSASCLLFQVGALYEQAQKFWDEIKERYEQGRYDTTRPLLPPEKIYWRVESLFNQLGNFSQITLQTGPLTKENPAYFNFTTLTPPTLLVEHRLDNPLHFLTDFLARYEGKILFSAETSGRREILLDLLKTIQIFPTHYTAWPDFLTGDQKWGITVSPLEEGLFLSEPSLCIITESELLGQPVIQQRRRKTKTYDTDAMFRNLAELNIDSPVVHIDHGVGRYKGLKTLEIDGIITEFLTLEYAKGDKLYIPITSLHLISRYSGNDSEHAPLNKLGSGDWEKTKKKAAEQICDVAAELLEIYAQRAAKLGDSFQIDPAQYRTFSSEFPFEETPDQQQAIQDVLADMQSPRCMDRLICGDVGFGKTEVAMRAAFIAAQNGKQVALLVPTTLLAQQHYENFKTRFANWPIQVDVVSRFRSSQKQKNTLEKLKAGTLDIIIGTHRLLQKDIQFHNIGLLVIDEEHRFGVQQKEKMKAWRTNIDVLTLTATPIPRTLNMSMANLRELSIIATPPARRLSIKTFVREKNDALLREAILRELLRGGQVYYLHNDVASINMCVKFIEKLIPEARVGIAHGQMPERALERVMADFYHRQFNVLVCSTIIETGIDVPSANTIIIERADKFGLAQLHQLRGRVGRSHHQAYAFLITPPKKNLSSDALKRLEAIEAFEDLGAGFTLATHDLEIRGAGELLGEEQSGNMQAIGFSLYMELLERAVNALKSGKQPELNKPLKYGVDIDLRMSALIPEFYIPDVHMRLVFYKRIASASDKNTLKDLQVEMIDRFGLLPPNTERLFDVAELKLLALPLGIEKIEAQTQMTKVTFSKHPNIDPTEIIRLIQQHPRQYKLDGSQCLRITWEQPEPATRIENIRHLIEKWRGKQDVKK